MSLDVLLQRRGPPAVVPSQQCTPRGKACQLGGQALGGIETTQDTTQSPSTQRPIRQQQKVHFHQNQNRKTVRQLKAEARFDGGGILRQRFAFHPQVVRLETKYAAFPSFFLHS